MRRRAALAVRGAAVILAAITAWPLVGAETRHLGVTAGIGGVRRTGAWTPVVVTAAPGELSVGEEIHVAVEDQDGQFVRSPAVVAVDDGSGGVAARCRVRFGRPSGRVRIDRGPGAGESAEYRLGEPIPATEGVLVVYGTLPAAARAARLIDRERRTKTRVVMVDPRRGGPAVYAEGAAARDYDAADAIVLCGSAVEALPAVVLAGIDAWVHDGGRLVLVSGASAQKLAEGKGIAAGWLPGSFERLVPLRRLGAIEAYARAAGLADRFGQAGLTVPTFAGPPAGVVDLSAFEGASGLPLVTRRCVGLGTVTWLGIDIDDDAIGSWQGGDTLLVALLGGRSRVGAEAGAAEATGVPDLAGQLRAALDTFPGGATGSAARPVPFELIAALGLIYVLCLYPLDWRIVSRDGGRPWLAWITLPALAAAFTGVAWVTAARWGGGRVVTARVADMVDVDAVTHHVRGSSWAAVLSPDNDRLDVAATPRLGRDGTVAVSWFADAGRGFGGLDAAVPHPSLAAADYAYGESLAVLDGVPIAAASSRLFAAEWSAVAASPVVSSSLFRTGQGTLGGGVAHHLPFALDGCRLLHAGWLYDVGPLRPGDRYDTEAGRGPRSLASAITRRAASKERDLAARWDPASTDVARILEVAAFHAAAGGDGYTGLEPGRLARLDMSPLLACDRAVLVGVVADAAPATSWRLDLRGSGTPADAVPVAPTLCRIVIPIAAEPQP